MCALSPEWVRIIFHIKSLCVPDRLSVATAVVNTMSSSNMNMYDALLIPVSRYTLGS